MMVRFRFGRETSVLFVGSAPKGSAGVMDRWSLAETGTELESRAVGIWTICFAFWRGALARFDRRRERCEGGAWAPVAIGLVMRALAVSEVVEQLACGAAGLVQFWAGRQDGTRSMAASPYGFWTSPITSDLVVGDSIRLEQVALDGDAIYWSETQPQKQGRTFVYRVGADGEPERVNPDDANAFSVRARAHEYGGGSLAVSDGVVYFSNNLDQRLYRQDAGRPPSPITQAPVGAAADALRYADGVVDRRRGRMVCVQIGRAHV